MINEQTIQLPPDSTANKNLLRAATITLPNNTTPLEQVIILADSDGNPVNVLHGGLVVIDESSRQLLSDIRDRLDILIDAIGR